MTAEPPDRRIDPRALERVPVLCPLCGCPSGGTYATANGYRIARCDRCSFLYVNPRPTEESLAALYSGRKNPYHAEVFEPLAYELPVLVQIVRRIQARVGRGVLLEVGCGRGDLLRVARAAGFEVTGCDFFDGHKPVDAGIAYVDGTLRQARFPDASFDVVINRNTLEHTFDPRVEMSEINRILKPGGHLYLKVPNVRFDHGWRCRLAFGARDLFDPPYHLNYFEPSSLRRLLRGCGLEFVTWFIERPSRQARWSANLPREAFYRLAQACRFVSGGWVFPKVLLTCLARKKR